MRINYDFGDLEAFLAVKETGSFHLAADRLNLSQSAITRRVQKLEEALDSILFERTTRAVKPTLAAKRLQARAEAILQDARETALVMRDESVAFAHQRNAIVTLATIPTVMTSLVIPALLAFQRNGQGVRVRLLDGDANEVAEAVAQGEADFGISSIPSLEAVTRFEPLFDDEIVLALPPGHRLKGSAVIDWSDINETLLILPARGTGNRLLIDEAMAQARLQAVWTYEVGRSSTALELAKNGAGAAFVPQSSLAATELSYCRLHNLNIKRPIGLLTRLGVQSVGAVDALKRAIKDHAPGSV